MKLTWIGHACFKIEAEGVSIVVDPYAKGSVPGLSDVDEEAHLIFCTHEHGDHNGRDQVKELDLPGDDHPYNILGFQTFHDDKNGSLRGMNTIFVIEYKGLRIAHMGDVGCALTNEQLFLLKNVDVLLIPVGGTFTVTAKQAREMVDQIGPKVVVPMHYRSDAFGYEVLTPVTDFTKLFEESVVKFYEESSIEISKDMENQVAVLTPARLAK